MLWSRIELKLAARRKGAVSEERGRAHGPKNEESDSEDSGGGAVEMYSGAEADDLSNLRHYRVRVRLDGAANPQVVQ